MDHHRRRELSIMPTQGRCSGSVNDHRLKVKARRHERRKTREEIRHWLGDASDGLPN